MAAPTVITDLNVSVGSNTPSSGDNVAPDLDNYLRGIQAILRRTNAKGSNIASASTTDIGASTDGDFIDVTGTTTITSLGTIAAGIVRTVRFTGSLTLTHNATSLILPGAANIQTAANDIAVFRSLGSGNWICESYPPQSGTYTPTLTAGSGFTSGTAQDAIYSRCGNVVHVDGAITGATVGGGAGVTVSVSLPIPSDFASAYQCQGSVVAYDASNIAITDVVAAYVTGSVTNNYASCIFFNNGAGSANFTIRYRFSYLVIP